MAREHWQRRLGKPLAAVVALIAVARNCPPLDVEVDGVHRRLLMLFVGSNAYTPRGFAPRGRRTLSTGVLDIRLLDEKHGGSITAVLAGALGLDLRRRSGYHERRTCEVTVEVVAEPTRLACDGEVFDAPRTVVFRMRPAALTVYPRPLSA